jgi:hypothetical protein
MRRGRAVATVATRMPATATIAATYETALTAKHAPGPAAANTRPPATEPPSRARLCETAPSSAAGPASSSGTACLTARRSAGAATAAVFPTTAAAT